MLTNTLFRNYFTPAIVLYYDIPYIYIVIQKQSKMTTTKKYNRSEIMKEAWRIWNDSVLRMVYKTWSACLKLAWEVAKEAMKENVVKSLFKSKGLVIDARCGNKSTYEVSDKEGFNNLYTKLQGTFAAKVMMTIARKQNGVATERQLEVIANSL